MNKNTQHVIKFQGLKSKKILANFKGGEITSDAGILLLRAIDKKLKFTENISKVFVDKRQKSKTKHSIKDMFRQRIFAIALGYEDLNDHEFLKNDKALQVGVGKESSLASTSTLCRFENSVNRNTAVEIHKKILENFVSSFKTPPTELVLDFDATDDPVHGKQEKKAYNGYYKMDCFLPLHVFCKDQLLVSYLRPSNQDGAKHAWAILSLLVKYFRKIWPNVKIIFRADSGFCRHKMLNWCDRNRVDYIVGIAGNNRLQKEISVTLTDAKISYLNTGKKQKIFKDFYYAAKTWDVKRKIIGKAEYNKKGSNMRFIVTSFIGDTEKIYNDEYCQRGKMENRIYEQLLLFSDRTSCHMWWPNQLRILLSALAYILLERIRTFFLKGTSLAFAQVNTIRLKLLKIGAIVIKNSRKILFQMSSNYPYQSLFTRLAEKINSS